MTAAPRRLQRAAASEAARDVDEDAFGCGSDAPRVLEGATGHPSQPWAHEVRSRRADAAGRRFPRIPASDDATRIAAEVIAEPQP